MMTEFMEEVKNIKIWNSNYKEVATTKWLKKEKNIQLLGKNPSSYSVVLKMFENGVNFAIIGKEIFRQ